MAHVVAAVSVSADGFVAGAGQTAGKPFGDGPAGCSRHPTRTGR
jgi:hypothetical protein